MSNYFQTHYKNVTLPIDTAKSAGLRNAQLGAIHALSSFFTLNSNQAAIVVMPTGSGKTAVLMLAPYMIRKRKVLVVTPPSTMVRGQIAEDFSLLYTLCKSNVFTSKMAKPKVFEMEHKFSDDDIPSYEGADVIVATPQCALSISESGWAKKEIDLVEIDEAHHTPAKTWQQILINLNEATHILFTATPFRLDRKEIIGEIVYSYPLSLAYSDGIFGEILYVPVDPGPTKDITIAQKAEEVLLTDRVAGFRHYLMVRTDTKNNAQLLEELYSQNTKLVLKRIDSSMTNAVIKKCIQSLKDGELDGIICVDMLGEGFDFPNLKIAAVHVPHKSLASTLQFIGRFARTNAKDIGTAKFIAANDEELQIENNHLYSNDAIWQEMIIDMSEGKTSHEQSERKYYKEYRTEQREGDERRISLQSINMNCHSKIYRVSGFNIEAIFPEELNVGDRIYRNHDDNTIIGISVNYVSPLWLVGDNKINKEYSLCVLHYQKETGFLHIYSQSHTEATYECLAEAFCDKHEKIPKTEMHRVLGNMSNFEIFNSGMVNRFSESGEAYRIMAGSDVSNAIDPSTGKMYSAGHVFCKANEITADGESNITVGYSSAAKVWSSAYKNLHEYVEWCDNQGKKIANDEISVKTNTNFDYLPHAIALKSYPDNIFFADYSPGTYTSSPVVKRVDGDAKRRRLTEYKISILNVTKQKVILSISSDDDCEQVECDINGLYANLSHNLCVCYGSHELSLADYLSENLLQFKTFDDSLIIGDELYEGVPNAISFDQRSIEAIDWAQYGTDMNLEFRHEADNGKVSIQDALQTILLDTHKYDYILYDHGTGEIADYIAIAETENEYVVELFHVKKMSGNTYNSHVDEVYEVAGQAVKSIIWFSTKGKFIEKIASRHQSDHCSMIVGDYATFVKAFRKTTKQLVGYIYIVQPALSKTTPMPDKIQEVLASASSYVGRAGKIKALKILGSA